MINHHYKIKGIFTNLFVASNEKTNTILYAPTLLNFSEVCFTCQIVLLCENLLNELNSLQVYRTFLIQTVKVPFGKTTTDIGFPFVYCIVSVFIC